MEMILRRQVKSAVVKADLVKTVGKYWMKPNAKLKNNYYHKCNWYRTLSHQRYL